MKTIKIGNRLIGDGQTCFIIAEAGVNHNGRLDLALKLVDKAVESGADAVKFQSFRADSIVVRDGCIFLRKIPGRRHEGQGGLVCDVYFPVHGCIKGVCV